MCCAGAARPAALAVAAIVLFVAGCGSPAEPSGTGPDRAQPSASLGVASIPSTEPVRASASPTAPAPTAIASSDPKPPVVTTSVLHEGAVSPKPRSVADRAWEPVVATHPTDPNRVAVVYEHRGPGAACSVNPPVRISHDGGRTWRTSESGPGAHSSRGMGLHAAIAWGPKARGGNRLYWANMTSPGCGAGRFSLTTSYSDDEGRTWSPLRVERRTPQWVGGFPEIAVDRDPRSPNLGTVYVGYNWYRPGAHGPGFRLLASSDYGRTWRAAEIKPVALAGEANDWWRIAYRLRPAPDGSVYATWYQVDLRHWDRLNIFAKGGSGNVQRLGVGIARIRFERASGRFVLGPSRIAAKVAETPWTTSGANAAGTAGNIRPDPMWQYGFDVDADGRLYVAVGAYGAPRKGFGRGTIRVGHSDDQGRTWRYVTLPAAPHVDGRRQSMLRPNLVTGPGYVLVTFRTLDDVGAGATMGGAYAVSSDQGTTWRFARPVHGIRWRVSNLDGVTNGAGLRERAERLADGDVFWAYGDGRRAAGRGAGRTAIFGARIHIAIR